MALTAKVDLVGAGRGDPELLTRKYWGCWIWPIAIVYDRLVSAEMLALGNPEATFVHEGKRQGSRKWSSAIGSGSGIGTERDACLRASCSVIILYAR